MFRLLHLLSLLALLPTFLFVAPPAHAAFPGANGKIAFHTYPGYQLHTIEPNGSGRTPLFAGREAAWSGDGQKLAFTRIHDVYTARPDGSDLFQVTQRDCDQFTCTDSYTGSWSPDGNRLALTNVFSVEPQGSVYMSVINADGSQEAFNWADESAEPAWSPDGSTLAYTSNGITTSTPAGGNITHITSGSHPAWSPDGSRIAFYRSGVPGQYGIWVMNADGTNQVQLTTSSVDFNPAWSPDGSTLVFERQVNGPTDLYTINVNGTGETNLTNTPDVSEEAPDWQPILYGYARPKGATQMTLKFVPAFEQCSSPNAIHGPPLVAGSCSPAVPESDFLTVGTPDTNGASANSAGSATMRSICNPPAPGAVPPCTAVGDQGDEEFQVSISDVRQKTTLLDYSGEIEARVTLRITDRWNGLCPGCPQPGTATDLPFSFAVPCATTPAGGIGSTCSVTTTANAVLPGAARESKRSVWGLGRFELYDGGPDGDADTPSATRSFAVQGLFAP